jgi:hypothetical protein
MLQFKVKPPRYDDALPLFVECVIELLGETGLEPHAFLRDPDGVLTLIVRAEIGDRERGELGILAKKRLGLYASDPPIAAPSDLFDMRLSDPLYDRLELVQLPDRQYFVRLIERRIIGQDWVRGILPAIPSAPPIAVFASHKGGSGRSTALAVAASEFVAKGKTILAIDLDLEAPGLGGMLLPPDDLPTFGALDYYVENDFGSLDDGFFDDMMSVSPLVGTQGRLVVVPATGRRCRAFPQNVIGKLSRAYLEDRVETGEASDSATFLDQTRSMISDLCKRDRYDAIFLDARAGLNETTAATIQGLGADILFFGIDAPQTWEGYRYFLAHLARFKAQVGSDDWRYRLKMVHAKASADPKAWSKYRDSAFELFAEHLYDEADESCQASDSIFSFDLEDREAPHYAWRILVDSTYYMFDPVSQREQLMEPMYTRTFGDFVTNLAERLKFE